MTFSVKISLDLLFPGKIGHIHLIFSLDLPVSRGLGGGGGGIQMRIGPLYPHAVRKRRLKLGRFLGIVKNWPRVGAWMGTLKNPTKCL